MRARLTIGWLILLSLVAAIGYAQQPPAQTSVSAAASAAPQAPARTLSLVDALEISRRNSPDYRAVLNDRWGTSRQLLSSTASLFTPTLSLNGSYFHRGSGGAQYFQGILFTPPGSSQQSASVNLNYNLSGATIANRGLAQADLRATDEDIAGALISLETVVRSQYLNVLQATAQSELARRALDRVAENLNLARARYSVGQGTLIDVRRAEVDKGQAEVTLLRAEQTVENQTLLLFNRMGVPAPDPARVQLTDSFPVTEPAFQFDQLVAQALAENPGLRALRARQTSAQWASRSARSEYLPSLNFNASTSRTRNRPDSSGAIYSYSTSPWQFSVGVSLPIYDGFSRYVRTGQAKAREDDVSLQVRARELGVRTDVAAAFYAMQAAYRTIDIQRANKAASAEALELASQRYRVGSGTYLELLDARNAADKADADFVTAVYDYHKAIASLENAVGRPLR
jgi:outer membrane protein